jgi:magnesium-transporting ATPase (P-type)
VLNLANAVLELGDCGAVQATCQALLSAGLFFFVANAKPRTVLSKERPHQSVFCIYSMTSLIIQFILQIGFIIYMFSRARAIMSSVRFSRVLLLIMKTLLCCSLARLP